ncbi:MAG: hypothetical protein HRU09_04990 [Oligoflexales bacterium]|nr:hypothetical protein [Oligoflexales bacterium]
MKNAARYLFLTIIFSFCSCKINDRSGESAYDDSQKKEQTKAKETNFAKSVNSVKAETLSFKKEYNDFKLALA